MNLDVSDRTIALPDPSLVFLLGPRGSGKTSFARRFFDPSEVVSLDGCRKLVGDDGATQGANAAAMSLFYSIIEGRLDAGKLVVVDADNTNVETRRPLVSLARKHHLFAVAIALQIDERVCIERNASRDDCVVSPYEVKREVDAIRKAIEFHAREGIRDIHVLRDARDVDHAVVARHRLWTDKRDDHGPFDIIGDVHGCADELEALLELLGYRVTWDDALPLGVRVLAPAGRRVIFLGDLVDRGPRIVDSLRIAMSMVDAGSALCVPGNHEAKLLRKLRGRTVSITHGLAETLAELEQTTAAFRDEVACFIDRLVGHYVLDGGRLCVAHAGIKEGMQGRSSSAAREFGLYGDTTGETDDVGLPVRQDWAAEYHGRACVVYGHTPMLVAEWVNNTICIDTGCVFGGALTALRVPERELISVPAAKRYFDPRKPLALRMSHATIAGESVPDDVPDLDALRTCGVVKTRFHHDVAVPAQQVFAVVEMLSRHCVDPRWLVYLPPVTSPVDASVRGGTLEHPEEAFAYYLRKGFSQVVCQAKHEGVRVVVVLCRDADVARSVFRVTDGRTGIVYTRTGRPFFETREKEESFVERLRAAAQRANVFHDHGPFVVFEADISTPNASPRAVADIAGNATMLDALSSAEARGIDIEMLRARLLRRHDRFTQYRHALTRSDEQVHRNELRITPVQVLATDETVWLTRPFSDHQALFAAMAAADEQIFTIAPSITVTLSSPPSPRSIAQQCVAGEGGRGGEVAGGVRSGLGEVRSVGVGDAALALWETCVATGVEAMLVKPFAFQRAAPSGLVLPALLCRTPSALRLAHGPEFDVEENLVRLANRSLSALRCRVLNQFALGMEALSRFVEREPSSRVHVCTSAALALECENPEPIS